MRVTSLMQNPLADPGALKFLEFHFQAAGGEQKIPGATVDEISHPSSTVVRNCVGELISITFWGTGMNNMETSLLMAIVIQTTKNTFYFWWIRSWEIWFQDSIRLI